jgi:single-stranded DNA-binding protein
MTNRVTIAGRLVETARVRRYERRDETIEIVSLWIEVPDADRPHRFTVDVSCAKAGVIARDLPEDALVEVTGKLRHDRWKDKDTGRWVGKVYIAVEPGGGTVRSKGMARKPAAAEESADMAA